MISTIKKTGAFAALLTLLISSILYSLPGQSVHAQTVISVSYQTHIQNEGWAQGFVSDGDLSGSEGKGLRLEGIMIKLTGDLPADLGIEYRTHIQNIGWETEYASDGEFSGSEGQGLRLEGIQIRLTGASADQYQVKYRTHIQNEGWAQGWVSDGQTAGSEGKGLRLEAIEIEIEEKPVITDAGDRNESQVLPAEDPQTSTDSSQGVNVKDFGAVGNGATNDTAAIQAALNASSVVNIPDGTYMINVDQALKPISGQTINLSSGAVLKALPSSNSYYSVIRISGVSNVTINGGTIVGERYSHTGSGGEWGMGIHVISGASNVNISGVTVKDCWGDGIFLGDSPTVSNIVIDNVISENNRRQGISITDATGVVIKNSIFRNTNGTLPEAGIDIEPDAGQTSRDIEIINVQCYGNNGSGLDLMGITGPISEVSVSSSDFSNNGGIGIRLVNSSSVAFTDVISNNNVYGVEIEKDVNTASFNGLTVANNKYRGVSLVTSGQSVGVDNIVFRNSVFKNNSQSQPGASDGIRIDAWDQSGYIKNVSFQSCQFLDTQSSKTQSYGLTIGYNSKVSGVTYDVGCVFSGNISGAFVADAAILKMA